MISFMWNLRNKEGKKAREINQETFLAIENKMMVTRGVGRGGGWVEQVVGIKECALVMSTE